MKAHSFILGYAGRSSALVTILLLLGWFSPSGLVVGATYFVASSNSTAARLAPGNGSEVSPWTNLSYGLSRIRGGDMLLVKSGTYEAPLYLDSRLSGSSNAPTIIRAFPGHTVPWSVRVATRAG